MNARVYPNEAAEALLALAATPVPKTVSLFDALGRVSAAELRAALPNPPFRRSAYDGYALSAADVAGATKACPVRLSIAGELPAGTAPDGALKSGAAIRILTGAPVPAGADAVAPQERVEAGNGVLTVFEPMKPGANVAPVGEDVAIGERLIGRGQRIGPAEAGLLAGQGLTGLAVYARPRVTLLSTGSELMNAGEALLPGKIYNTNAYTIGGYLKALGAECIDGGVVRDEAEAVAGAIRAALDASDAVFLTGGASVGDYDYTLAAMRRLGGEILFDRVAMKPGGAMLAARIGGKAVVGLSGNPGAAALGLLRVAAPFVKALSGRADTAWPRVSVRLAASMDKASPQTRLLRGRLDIRAGAAYLVETGRQLNGAVSSLTGCDLLGEIPAGSPPLPAETTVEAYRILL